MFSYGFISNKLSNYQESEHRISDKPFDKNDINGEQLWQNSQTICQKTEVNETLKAHSPVIGGMAGLVRRVWEVRVVGV